MKNLNKHSQRFRRKENFSPRFVILCCLLLIVTFGAFSTLASNDAIVSKTAFSETNLQQKSVSIKGSVVDETGLGVPGVFVRLKSLPTAGTVTSVDGNYALNNVPANGTLVFSSLGYKTTEVQIDGQSTINITLEEDTETLEDVVVVAYGVQKKATLTGSVAAISTKEIKQSPTANLAVALTGRLPGLIAIQRSGEPGRDETLLYMRGRGTVNGQDPLILVDGVERELNSIDPSEVDNVSILKDASSTALFGVRGANGVILVTTKRGTDEIPTISLNVESGRQTFTRWPSVVNAYDWAQLKNQAWHNDNPNPLPTEAPPFSDYALERYRLNDWPEVYSNTNWVDKLMQKWVSQTRYNLTLNGKGANVGYFVNVGYLNQGGQWKIDPEPKSYNPHNYMKRYNFRSNIDATLTRDKSLRAFLNAAGFLEQVNGPHVGDEYNNSSATTQIITRILNRWPSIQPGPLTPDGEVLVGGSGYDVSPWAQINRSGYRKESRSSVTATFGLVQNFDKWVRGLSAALRASFDTKAINYMNAGKTYQIWNQIIDPKSKGQDGRDSVYYSRTRVDLDNSTLTTYTSASYQSFFDIQFQLDYNRKFGDLHNVTGLFLAKQQMLIKPGYDLPFNIREVAMRWIYGYSDRYILELNGNYSGSEQFAPSNRYGFFPAVSAAWLISNEDFFYGLSSTVNNLKIRGSYGTVGNDKMKTSRFLYLDDVHPRWEGYSTILGRNQWIEEKFFGNPHVQWETATKMNIGFDLGLFKSLNIVFDVFKEKRDNILIDKQTIPTLTGVPSASIAPFNIGKVDNQGYEVEVIYNKSVNKDLYVIAKANFSYNDNKIVFIDELKYDSTFAYPYRNTGYQIGQHWGYKALGFFNDQQEIDNYGVTYQGRQPRPGDLIFADLNGDKIIDLKDVMPIGNSNVPKYSWGAAFNVTYKNFDISVLFQGVFKTSSEIPAWEWYDFRDFHKTAWTPERAASGEKITYPALSLSTSASSYGSTFFIQDRSFVRLKNLEIGYKLPKKWSSAINAKSIRFYANGFNLITWDKLKFKDWDPELRNIDSYPVLKTINFGANITF